MSEAKPTIAGDGFRGAQPILRIAKLERQWGMMRSRWVRWTIRILLGLVALLGAGIAALFVLNPMAALLLLTILRHPFGNAKPPEMLKAEIAGLWGKWDEAGQRLTTRLQNEFPPGTPEGTLKSTLLKQGFEPLPPPPSDCVRAGEHVPPGGVYIPCPTHDSSKELVYHWSSVICTETIGVDWATDGANAITQVKAGYSAGCL